MIEELPGTSVSAVARRLVSMRQESGVAALGRVLTLVIAATGSLDEAVVEAANDASNEHPMRVIVLLTRPEGAPRLDAEIRVGADAGASEVVVLRAYGDVCTGVESLVSGLLLPDAPVVVWWPGDAPERPGSDPLGRIAQRRITDSASITDAAEQARRIDAYTPGDTDLAWTRLTRWREHLAAMLDQPPFDAVTSVDVVGKAGSMSTQLLAAWLQLALERPTVCRLPDENQLAEGVRSVTLSRASGDAVLERVSGSRTLLRQPGHPTHEIALPRRTLSECLAEELRRLDEDVMYRRVLERLSRIRAAQEALGNRTSEWSTDHD
ncbi:glucose-6-phosphate dehydrogenase assembly protein OpcA [Leucobacter sp. wl10]|uniref:glucose-6-phosphate dehydrogenase assembly protein OpcA n=1 Tax=Leucobacter sp. wl10 TaxID=2304677 RepID=UPI000E5ADF65|nr:glucose-6-phosphate dehydrogenase assembly protein OpcA [Leucobacter sp. wl10]RGE17935.1 OpcA protein [Leucobacter sp. wl10]